MALSAPEVVWTPEEYLPAAPGPDAPAVRQAALQAVQASVLFPPAG
jgi:hypothetical protein